MAVICLILGESGTGKSASMRNFKQGEMALVNIGKKPLPFRGDDFNFIKSDNESEIKRFMDNCEENIIVVDDAQFLLGFHYMHTCTENGWDKYMQMQSKYFNVIENAMNLPDNKIVFFLSHLETKEDGRQKVKTIGKMLDEKITVEGLFTIVLKTLVSDGKYYFTTQNSGMDTVKSPIGMFPSNVIENDLKYVAEKIRNYYGMAGAITDAEMEKADEAVKTEIAPTEKPRRRRKQAEAEKPAETVTVTVVDQKGEDVVEVPVVEEENAPAPAEAEQPKVRRRKRREQAPANEAEKSVELPF